MEILSLGEKIKRKRKELNMTLKDVAKDRITPGQISLVESGRSNPSMDLLEYLAANLNTTVEYLMESEESQAERISMYYEQITEIYLLSNNYPKSEKYLEEAFNYATIYKLDYRKAKIMSLKGEVSKLKNNYEEAKEMYLSAIIIFSNNKKYEEVVKSFLNLGKISTTLKENTIAINYFKQAEAVYLDHDITNEYLIGEVYYYISKIYYLIERVEDSKKYAYLAKEKYDKLFNKEEYANSLVLLSEECIKKGDLMNATNYSQRALNIYKKLSHSNNTSNIEQNLGELFYNFKDISESYIHLHNAIKISESNDKNKEIDILIDICKNDVKMKNLEQCEIKLMDLYKRIDKNDVHRTISLNLIKYRIFIIDERLEEAENILIKSYNMAKEKDKLKVAGELSILISKFYIDHKKEDLSKKFLDEGVRILRNLGSS